MKIKELKELSVAELNRKEAELRAETMNLRIQQASGQLENPARITAVRRSIARIQTLLSHHRNQAVK